MNTKILKREMMKYIVPSMLAMLLSGFYAIVDGLFIGNAVGNTALGAINIVWPLQCLINATSIGLGVGSAVLMSTYLGNDRMDQANKTCGLGMMLLFSTGILLPLSLYAFLPHLFSFLGVTPDLDALCRQYIVVLLLGGIFPTLGNGLNPLIRNRGKTVSATLIMSSGLVTNIILDYLLVFYWRLGLFGAGLATMLSQAVVAVLSLLFLWFQEHDVFQRNHFHWDLKEVGKIVHIGISPFGQTLVPSLVIIFTNWKCIQYGGSAAVTVFSVVSYVLGTMQLLLQGIGDGVQPLLSFYKGAHKEDEVSWIFKHAFYITCIFSLLCSIIVWRYADILSLLFGIESTLLGMCMHALRLAAISFIGLGIARLICSFFYATGSQRESTVLVYIEPCLIMPLGLLIMSLLFQLEGVWMAYPIVQFIIAGLSLALKKHRTLHPGYE